jgi:hypothetical protein
MSSSVREINKSAFDVVHKIAEPIRGYELYNMQIDKLPCLIGDIVPSVGIFAIGGSSDTGKSMLFRQMGICIALNTDFIGFEVKPIHQKVIFVSSEDDDRATSFLIRKQSDDNEDLDNIRFHFGCDDIVEWLDYQLTIEPADLVVVDAFGDVFGQNLNDTSLIRQTLNFYKDLAVKHACAIGFLHHTGKRTQKLTPSKDNLLSGQGFEAKMRLVFELRTDIKDDDIKHLCIVKGNYLGKEHKNSSYKLLMDSESFRFTYTGERVLFDDLATISENGKEIKSEIGPPNMIDPLIHIGITNSIFEKKKHLKLAELKELLSNKYTEHFGIYFGEKRTELYLKHLMNSLQIIGINGKDRSPNKYYYLTTDHLLLT